MTATENAPNYTRQFWAKSEPRHGYPKRIHLLEHHLADVGACFETLLDQPTIRQRLARSGGLNFLDKATESRLALFAALHDIGKVNAGFQTQIWEQEYLRGNPRINRAGHTLDLTPVLDQNKDKETAAWFFNALGWWWDATESWDDCDGETVCALFVAALSHHGQPLQLDNDRSRNPSIWRSYGNLRPQECVERIGELAQQWFPAAFAENAPPLPSSPKFQHMFLGLCILADWIGSNEEWFPFSEEPDDNYMDAVARPQAEKAMNAVRLDLAAQRGQFPGVPGFAQLFGDDKHPNAIQQAATQTPLHEPLVIIESENGSGKTEAALWRFARMYEDGLVDGLYFALPTRAAAVQIHWRVQDFSANLFPEGRSPSVVLAVPGYDSGAAPGIAVLPDYNSHAAGHFEADRPWASENPKRYLAAQIAVGTVDQAMMATLKIKHAHLRAACLSRNLLVVDEVHASDPYMRSILKALLDAHTGAGGYALLMSATLGSVARSQWLSPGRLNFNHAPTMDEALNAPYPAVSVRTAREESIAPVGENGQEKTVSISAEPIIHEFDRVADLALQAARTGAKVLVIRNTVSNAINTQQVLEQAAGNASEFLFSASGTATLHHSRFAAPDRRLLDTEAERRLGKDRVAGGIVVVGTQTLEQSLDIDADLLITDLCPVDVLLQRVGRLHRHHRSDRPASYAAPRCIVLTPGTENLSPLLQAGSNRTGLGPYGYVYKDLRVLEATRRLIGQYEEWDIPKMNRLLVENATHPDVLEDLVKEMGDDWKEHESKILGEVIAETQGANGHVIQRDKSFFTGNREVLFPSDDERIRTRLGDESLEVEFNSPQPGPFEPSRAILRIAVPLRWMGSAGVPAAVEPSPATDGGFTFSVGDRAFRYDRLGLRRE